MEKIDEKILIEKFKPLISIKIKKEIGYTNPDWEDLTNEVLMKAIEALRKNRFEHKSSIGTYIYGITKNVISTYKFKKGRERKKIEKSHDNGFYEKNPVYEYEREESINFISKKIKELDFKYRHVLYLYYYQSLPRETIARILNLSLNKVDARINYAIKLLRKEILKK